MTSCDTNILFDALEATRPGPAARIMDATWERAADHAFARRRIFDIRLALTLRHHGVTRFATANVRDFQDFGFDHVWNPLEC